jgi:hypothetical protein
MTRMRHDIQDCGYVPVSSRLANDKVMSLPLLYTVDTLVLDRLEAKGPLESRMHEDSSRVPSAKSFQVVAVLVEPLSRKHMENAYAVIFISGVSQKLVGVHRRAHLAR